MSEIRRRFNFSGVSEVWHDVRATDVLPTYLARQGYKRAFVVCSKTLNTKTKVVSNIVGSLEGRIVRVTDNVGEHAPIKNIIAAAIEARDLEADVIIGIGGGSIIDFCKMLQLCLTEQCFEKQKFFEYKLKWDGDEPLSGSTTRPSVRQIIVPTTLATAEWTNGGTPVDEETRLKTLFTMTDGGPELIVYDPEILKHTPLHLLMSTGIRGLDHAINTRCSTAPHPMSNVLTEAAIKLWVENLPLVKENPNDLKVLNNVQLACWYTGICQLSSIHGFSHFMVHVLAPYAKISHSDAACVLMLAQAKWQEGYAEEPHSAILAAMGFSGRPLHAVIDDLLQKLALPRTLNDLGVAPELIDELIQPALDYKLVTAFNVRPIKTGDDIRKVLDLAWA